jgi:hypothetical protein
MPTLAALAADPSRTRARRHVRARCAAKRASGKNSPRRTPMAHARALVARTTSRKVASKTEASVSGQTIYGYVLQDPVNFIDPFGLATIVVIDNAGTGHVGVLVGDPTGQTRNRLGEKESRILYDPNGRYEPTTVKGEPGRGTSDAMINNDFNLLRYIRYQNDNSSGIIYGGSDVYVYVFDTTPEDEILIANKIYTMPSTSWWPVCAENSAIVLKVIDLFKNLDTKNSPGNVKRQLDDLVKAGKGTTQTAQDYLKNNTFDPGTKKDNLDKSKNKNTKQ